MYWMPKTKLGRWSFWIVIFSFALIMINYWIAMLIDFRLPLPGILMMSLVVIFGITSIISLFFRKDKSYLLILSSIFGLIGIAFVIGEIVYPH